MGAWGSGVFENDNACDFAEAVSNGDGIALLDQALDRVLACGSNYLEAPEGQECLAAAEIIARQTGNAGDQTAYTASVDAWIKRGQPSPSAAVVEKAKRAVTRVLAPPSELVELWTESENFDDWRLSVEALLARL